MKKFINAISKSMKGSFLPKSLGEERILKGINESLEKLDYYGLECDKRNMKGDISALNKDFNKATQKAKINFSSIL